MKKQKICSLILTLILILTCIPISSNGAVTPESLEKADTSISASASENNAALYAANKIKTKKYTISKQAGTYSSQIKVKIKAKKGYKVYYSLNGKFKAKKVIKSKKKKTITISSTKTLHVYAVKSSKKITNKKLKAKAVKKCKNYTYTINRINETPNTVQNPNNAEENKVIAYTVTFDTNGGTVIPSQSINNGSKATIPTSPTKEGYVFAGWYIDESCTTEYNFNTPVTNNITLYAKWDISTKYYTIIFESNGGSAIDSQNIEEGSLVIRPDDPIREGYRLIAWYTDESLTEVYNFDEPVTKDITLYASWEELVEENSFLDQAPPDVEIYSFDADCLSVPVNEEQTVTFKSEIFAETALNTNEVALYQDDELLSVMYDDGTNGDEIANDGIYTYQSTFSSNIECTKSYQVKVREAVSEIREIGFYVPMSEDDLNGMQQVDTALADLTSTENFDALTIEDKANSVIEVLNTMVDEGLVVEDSIYYDEIDRIVYYKYNTDALGVVSLEQNEEWNTDSSHDKRQRADSNMYSTPTTISNQTNTEIVTASNEESNERNVLILNGFENSSYRRDYYTNLESEWDSLGLNTTVDVDVTVEDMKSLNESDWDVVVFAMHGSKYRVESGSNKQPVLCINENATDDTDDAYDYELTQSHTIIKHTGGGNNSYWIVPQFFTDTYSSTDLDGMMFFSETCMFYGCDCQSTTPDYVMANAIIGRSAEVVIGYHNSVGADYSRNVMKIVIEETFNGETINESLNIATSSEGDNDNMSDASSDKYESYPIISGNENYVLRPDGFIMGNVKDADTNENISNALVRAYDKNNDNVGSTRSDSSGSYTLGLPAGDYVLEISAGSYKKGKIAVTVNSEGTTYVETSLLVSNLFDIGSVNGTITNSITEMPVSNVTVRFRKNWNNKTGIVVASITTNTNGYYEINDLDVGLYTIEYYKSGFVTGYKNIFVLLGSTHDAIISPVTSTGVYRMVLTWGNDPSDLDSHVEGVLSNDESFHVYYSYRSEYDGDIEVCNLDVDDVDGYGPETTTLIPTTTKPYYYYIHRYSGSGSISTSGAQVKLYNGDSLIDTFNAPTDQGTDDYWNIFAINDGEIIINNTISSSANTSYAN